MSPTPPYSLHIQTAPHRLVERATKATAPNIAKAAELKAVIEATPRGPSQERRAARLALKQERARVVAELNEARKAARAALDAASAPSGPRDDGKPTARGAARQALIVARLSIELARNAFATDKPEATPTPSSNSAEPTPLRMKDATAEQVEAAIAEMIRVTSAFRACRTPEVMALPACFLDNRKACRKAFDEAVTGFQADVAEADTKLMIAQLAVQLHKKAMSTAATGADEANATSTASAGDAAADRTPDGDVWAITLENAPADLLELASGKAATIQQRLEELRAAIEAAERDDYKEAFRAELHEFRMRSMVGLHADRACARAKLIVSRRTIAMLRNGRPGHLHRHHCHHRRGQHHCGRWHGGVYGGGGPHKTGIIAVLMQNGHLQLRFGHSNGPHCRGAHCASNKHGPRGFHGTHSVPDRHPHQGNGWLRGGRHHVARQGGAFRGTTGTQ